MGTTAIPYIMFGGNARAALEFYQSAFGGKVEISTFGDFNVPDAPADGVMHGALTSDSLSVYCSDAMSTGEPANASRIRIAIVGDDLQTLTASFDALAQGGQVVTGLEKQMWGDVYGEIVDQYGISWMFNIATPV